VLRTAVGVASRAATITFTGIDRTGRPISDNSQNVMLPVLLNLDTGRTTFAFSSGVVAATVPQGRYEISTSLTTGTADDPASDVTMIEDPEVTVAGDMTHVADARRGVKATTTVDRPVDAVQDGARVSEMVAGTPAGFVTFAAGQHLFVTPTTRITDRPFTFTLTSERDNSAPDNGFIPTIAYLLAFQASGRIPGTLTRRVHDGDLAVIHRTYRQQGVVAGFPSFEFDTLVPAPGGLPGLASISFFPPVGGTVTEYVSPSAWQTSVLQDSAYWEDGPVTSYRAGHSYSDDWGSAAPGNASATTRAIGARASFDDGKTWHPLTLRPGAPGTWTTTVTPPPGTAFVSLSANLTDSAGNSTRQTVIRAYQVASPAR
jgi:hypothetical protein